MTVWHRNLKAYFPLFLIIPPIWHWLLHGKMLTLWPMEQFLRLQNWKSLCYWYSDHCGKPDYTEKIGFSGSFFGVKLFDDKWNETEKCLLCATDWNCFHNLKGMCQITECQLTQRSREVSGLVQGSNKSVFLGILFLHF